MTGMEVACSLKVKINYLQVDPLEGEQTWPTEEELNEAEKLAAPKSRTKRVPKGTSEYQAAWIIESDNGR